MNPYTIELLAKERQRELEEDMKRIQLARTVRKPGPGIFKKFILGLCTIIFPMRVLRKIVTAQLSNRC